MLLSRVMNWIKSAISKLRSSKFKPGWTWPRPASERKSLSPEDRLKRSVEARQLLENRTLQEAFQAIEADLLRQFRACDLADKEGHARLVMAYQMSHAIGKHLWNLIQDGTVAAGEINVRGRRID